MRYFSTMGAVALALLATAACNKTPAPLAAASTDVPSQQGWDLKTKTAFYTYSQGSRLLPLSWARALEMANSTDLFLSPAHIATLGYLPAADGKADSLPIGFVVDTPADEKQLSYTAVHWTARQDQAGATPEPWM